MFPWTFEHARAGIPLNSEETALFEDWGKSMALELNKLYKKVDKKRVKDRNHANNDLGPRSFRGLMARQIMFAEVTQYLVQSFDSITLFVKFTDMYNKQGAVGKSYDFEPVPIPLRLAVTMPSVRRLVPAFLKNFFNGPFYAEQVKAVDFFGQTKHHLSRQKLFSLAQYFYPEKNRDLDFVRFPEVRLVDSSDGDTWLNHFQGELSAMKPEIRRLHSLYFGQQEANEPGSLATFFIEATQGLESKEDDDEQQPEPREPLQTECEIPAEPSSTANRERRRKRKRSARSDSSSSSSSSSANQIEHDEEQEETDEVDIIALDEEDDAKEPGFEHDNPLRSPVIVPLRKFNNDHDQTPSAKRQIESATTARETPDSETVLDVELMMKKSDIEKIVVDYINKNVIPSIRLLHGTIVDLQQIESYLRLVVPKMVEAQFLHRQQLNHGPILEKLRPEIEQISLQNYKQLTQENEQLRVELAEIKRQITAMQSTNKEAFKKLEQRQKTFTASAKEASQELERAEEARRNLARRVEEVALQVNGLTDFANAIAPRVTALEESQTELKKDLSKAGEKFKELTANNLIGTFFPARGLVDPDEAYPFQGDVDSYIPGAHN
jgi:archaellum component FlaC